MKHTYPSILFLFLFLLCNCQEEKITLVTINGSLQGFIHQSSGATAGLGDVKVSVEGTDPVVSVLSGSNGKYVISDIPMGTYNLIFEKPGYGTYKIMGYSLIGGKVPDNLNPIVLFKVPDIEIKDVQADITAYGNYAYVNGTIFTDVSTEGNSNYSNYRYYINTTPDIAPNTYSETGTFFSYGGSSTTFRVTLLTQKYPPGSTIYFTLYPCSDPYSSYMDLNTGNMIYATITQKGSKVLSFKIPV